MKSRDLTLLFNNFAHFVLSLCETCKKNGKPCLAEVLRNIKFVEYFSFLRIVQVESSRIEQCLSYSFSKYFLFVDCYSKISIQQRHPKKCNVLKFCN